MRAVLPDAPHTLQQRGDAAMERQPDMVLHDGRTRIFGPVLTDEEFELRDEELAIGILEFCEALAKQKEGTS